MSSAAISCRATRCRLTAVTFGNPTISGPTRCRMRLPGMTMSSSTSVRCRMPARTSRSAVNEPSAPTPMIATRASWSWGEPDQRGPSWRKGCRLQHGGGERQYLRLSSATPRARSHRRGCRAGKRAPRSRPSDSESAVQIHVGGDACARRPAGSWWNVDVPEIGGHIRRGPCCAWMPSAGACRSRSAWCCCHSGEIRTDP